MGGGMMAPVLSVATGLLIFVILITFAPTIAGSVQNAQPSDNLKEMCVYGYPPSTVTYAQCAGTGNISARIGGNASEWNTTDNTDLPTGVDEWTTNIQILGVVVLIISIAIAMYYLKSMA
jgi:hypothetical protein